MIPDKLPDGREANVPTGNRGRRLTGALLISLGFLLLVSQYPAGTAMWLLWIGLVLVLRGSHIVRWGGGFVLAVLLVTVVVNAMEACNAYGANHGEGHLSR